MPSATALPNGELKQEQTQKTKDGPTPQTAPRSDANKLLDKWWTKPNPTPMIAVKAKTEN